MAIDPQGRTPMVYDATNYARCHTLDRTNSTRSTRRPASGCSSGAAALAAVSPPRGEVGPLYCAAAWATAARRASRASAMSPRASRGGGAQVGVEQLLQRAARLIDRAEPWLHCIDSISKRRENTRAEPSPAPVRRRHSGTEAHRTTHLLVARAEERSWSDSLPLRLRSLWWPNNSVHLRQARSSIGNTHRLGAEGVNCIALFGRLRDRA
jgi:hypothetical protein